MDWYEKDIMNADLPYWYNERTNVGNLALATYQLSGFPLQEFSCVKGKGASRSDGRADLYVRLPRKGLSSRSEYVDLNIESKQIWRSLHLGEQATEAIKNKLAVVMRDCKAIKDPDWKVKLGVGLLFVLPYKQDIRGIRKSVLEQDITMFVRDMTRVVKDLDASFVACHLANTEISRRIYNANHRYGWCPGIVAIGKLVE